MVGIVLISHSAGLAEEAVALAVGIAGEDAPIRPAGGTDDGDLGTSLTKLEEAVAEVDQGDGVVVIMDLGSAVLTARTFIEDRADVVLADAPFVEGAINALVTAGTGAALDEVVAAAEEARTIGKLC
ncbi:phosphoenolpyruvate--protein phosphotransferase [Herbidospora galbida]|uniref:phosphoenolpyruvate--glycerone phosphotransferase n=1 Tax=Herbidospora galbida TaxID=2575442 RepID=A0A4U3MAG2_9ACTN|nr:dihydroxyacetone kinase phosphoryl donor subunit DhaM [Herbidospora galbida]TKK86118.1 phosphoenolpyruvate--protein phosphotransferase [Herbidospora galbida]